MIEYSDYARSIFRIISYGDEEITDFLSKYKDITSEDANFAFEHCFQKITLLISKLLEEIGPLNSTCLIAIGSKEYDDSSKLCLDNYEAFIKSVLG